MKDVYKHVVNGNIHVYHRSEEMHYKQGSMQVNEIGCSSWLKFLKTQV